MDLTPLISQKVLKDGDVMKVDFGVHVKGRILDSAFTLSWDPDYENLLTAVKEATNTGVRVRSPILGDGFSRYSSILIGSWYRCQTGRARRSHSRGYGVL